VPKTLEATGSVLSTYLPAPDAALVRDRAKAAERTVAAELRLALREYLDRSGGSPGPALVERRESGREQQ
jgi:hypothetical protein